MSSRGRLSFVVALGLMFASPFLAATEMYQWTDADGKTHLSERPPADYQAERMAIRRFAPPAEASSNPGARVPRVVMLSAAWCEVCGEARRWLTRNRVAFTEFDVERDPQGRDRFKRLHGKGVPIILVGDQRLDGFSAGRLRAMLANAAK